MKHALLILAHKDFNHLLEIIRFFRGEFYIYIHIDKKGSITSDEQSALREMKNVRSVESRYAINWGGYNVLKGVVHLMRVAVKDDLADYYHLISGQDFPTKSPEELTRFFEQRKGTEFLNYFSLPYKGWDNGRMDRLTLYCLYDYFNFKNPREKEILDKLDRWQKRYHICRKLPLKRYPILYGGSCWWSLSRECVRYLVEETNCHPYLYRRLRNTFAPDEVYVQTILLHSPFKLKIENDNLRYIVWETGNNNYPANLDETDFTKINSATNFFARKIEYPVSSSLVEMLENRQMSENQEKELAISVVMPMYNVAPYLRESIDSILCQSFHDFELILVDDGSTDEGLSIARSYSDPRIRIIENEHNYIDSLNKGLQAAQGKYIARMDADDRMTFERLSVQYSFMELHPEVDVCGAWHRIFGLNYKTTLRQFPQKHNEIVTCILREENPMSHPTAFIKRSFLVDHELKYDADALYAEDLQFWIDIIKAGGRFINLPHYLHEYRQSETQVIRTQSKQMFSNSCSIYFNFLGYVMNELGEQDQELWQVMEQMIKMTNKRVIPYVVLRNFVAGIYSDYLSRLNTKQEKGA